MPNLLEQNLSIAGSPVSEDNENPGGYMSLFRGVANTGKELIQNEVALIKTELKQSLSDLSTQLVQIVVFGGLFALTLLPFLAFCVIGLGKLLDDQYWLSSLIVAVVCGIVGGTLTYRAYKNMKNLKPPLARAAASIEKSVETVKEEFSN